ncbi:MAG: chemotaxis protein CheB [Gammaproteobacteria bacterium]
MSNQVSLQPRKVVVLRASVGGAVMLRRFFERLPVDFSFAFIIVMPIADEFSDHFIDRMSDISGLEVKRPVIGNRLAANHCWLLSEDDQISFSQDGALDWIEHSSQRSARHSILNEVASVFGKDSGAIFLSGDSADIADGCRVLVSHGGFVFAQSADSCVVSGLSDAARDSECVEVCGTPEELMYALHQRYQVSNSLLC